jgi:RNA polymerase sigma-70 factor (ECF subfamily)
MAQQHSEEFVALLTASQRRIHAFICTLVVDLADADEVLQETNLALWQQAERFEPGTDFVAWACRVAYFKVLKQRDAAKRHRVKLDDAVMDLLATETIERTREQAREAAETFERQRVAAWACVDELSERHRDVLTARYRDGRSLGDIGVTLGRNANAMAQVFHRIRAILRECVERKLSALEG